MRNLISAGVIASGLLFLVAGAAARDLSPAEKSRLAELNKQLDRDEAIGEVAIVDVCKELQPNRKQAIEAGAKKLAEGAPPKSKDVIDFTASKSFVTAVNERKKVIHSAQGDDKAAIIGMCENLSK
jgi:hypothetical protein